MFRSEQTLQMENEELRMQIQKLKLRERINSNRTMTYQHSRASTFFVNNLETTRSLVHTYSNDSASSFFASSIPKHTLTFRTPRSDDGQWEEKFHDALEENEQLHSRMDALYKLIDDVKQESATFLTERSDAYISRIQALEQENQELKEWKPKHSWRITQFQHPLANAALGRASFASSDRSSRFSTHAIDHHLTDLQAQLSVDEEQISSLCDELAQMQEEHQQFRIRILELQATVDELTLLLGAEKQKAELMQQELEGMSASFGECLPQINLMDLPHQDLMAQLQQDDMELDLQEAIDVQGQNLLDLEEQLDAAKHSEQRACAQLKGMPGLCGTHTNDCTEIARSGSLLHETCAPVRDLQKEAAIGAAAEVHDLLPHIIELQRQKARSELARHEMQLNESFWAFDSFFNMLSCGSNRTPAG